MLHAGGALLPRLAVGQTGYAPGNEDPLLSGGVRRIGEPMLPARPNTPPGRTPLPTPDPIRSPIPENNVTLPRHPFPAPSHPSPHTPHQPPFLPHFFPPIRPDPEFSPALLKYTHIRATFAGARDRPRGPATLPPGIRRGVENWPQATNHLPATCPTLSRGVTLLSQMTRAGITESRSTGDTFS